MKKRALYLILPIVTLVLECLPFGAVCNFALDQGETVRKTFSYFDPVPFGYANFAPLLTAAHLGAFGDLGIFRGNGAGKMGGTCKNSLRPCRRALAWAPALRHLLFLAGGRTDHGDTRG